MNRNLRVDLNRVKLLWIVRVEGWFAITIAGNTCTHRECASERETNWTHTHTYTHICVHCTCSSMVWMYFKHLTSALHGAVERWFRYRSGRRWRWWWYFEGDGNQLTSVMKIIVVHATYQAVDWNWFWSFELHFKIFRSSLITSLALMWTHALTAIFAHTNTFSHAFGQWSQDKKKAIRALFHFVFSFKMRQFYVCAHSLSLSRSRQGAPGFRF